MDYLEMVANFAEQYFSAAKSKKSVILKVAESMGVEYKDMVAFYNVFKGNIFTNENLLEISEDTDFSQIEIIIALWERIASESIGPVGIEMIIENTDLKEYEIDMILNELDKKALEAGVFNYDEPTADEATWNKIANAHSKFLELGINPLRGVELLLDIRGSEDKDEVLDIIFNFYHEVNEENLENVMDILEELADIEKPYDLMESYDKENTISNEFGNRTFTAKRYIETIFSKKREFIMNEIKKSIEE